MRELIRKLETPRPAARTLTLSFDERSKSRQRVRLDDGEEMAMLLPRGTVLRGGDLIITNDDVVVAVRAAREVLSSVEASDGFTLARAAYHLGNRHVPLEVGPGHVRYQHDHVLDDLVRALGLSPTVLEAGFEPEAGAYGGGHAHGHHQHGHGQHQHGHTQLHEQPEHHHPHGDDQGERGA